MTCKGCKLQSSHIAGSAPNLRVEGRSCFGVRNSKRLGRKPCHGCRTAVQRAKPAVALKMTCQIQDVGITEQPASMLGHWPTSQQLQVLHICRPVRTKAPPSLQSGCLPWARESLTAVCQPVACLKLAQHLILLGCMGCGPSSGTLVSCMSIPSGAVGYASDVLRSILNQLTERLMTLLKDVTQCVGGKVVTSVSRRWP